MSGIQSTIIIGDLTVKPAQNTALHGPGLLNVPDEVRLSNIASKVKSTDGDLTIEAGTALRPNSSLTLKARNGAGSTKGNIAIQAGDGGLDCQSLGITNISGVGNTTVQSDANLALRGQVDTTLTATTGDIVLSTPASGKTIALKHGTTARVTAAETQVDIDAPGVLVGKTSATIKMGNPNASTTTTIYGDLIVSGATSTVSTTNTAIDDQMLVLGGAPQTVNNLTGLYIQRDYAAAIVGQSAIATTTSSSDCAIGATVLAVTSGTGIIAGQVLKMINGGVSYYNDVRSVSGNNITLYNPNPVLISSGAAVTTYHKNAGVMVWDESAKQYKVGFTNSTKTDGNVILEPILGDLHVNRLTTDQPLENSSIATTTVTLAANTTAAVALAPLTTKYRGSVMLIVEAPFKGGAGAALSVVKMNEDNASFVSAGCTSDSSLGERLEVYWPVTTGPQLKHGVIRSSGTAGTGVGQLSENIVYSIKYMTV